VHRAPLRLALVLVVTLALPAAAAARPWRPAASSTTGSRGQLPLEPIADEVPLAFPSRTAPRIIVGVEPGADLDAVAAELRPYASSLHVLRAVGEVSLQASNGAAVAARAARDSRVAFAEPDRTLGAQADQFDSPDPATGILYDWQYDAVSAGPAIAAVGGGSSTIVAIVDSGIDVDQPDLAGRILPGYDATGTDGTVTDNVGHGTFVAGLVSMVDGNGIGGKGIAGATNVLPVRASIDSGFRENVTIAGIIWAADHGAGVINLSLGGPHDDPALDRAIDYATSKNAVVVAAAGNDGDTPTNPIDYPAAYLGARAGGWSIGLSVGATMPNNQIATFSTHNDYVSVAAPGAGATGCSFGDFSTLPANTNTEWDSPPGDPCNNVLYSTPADVATDGRWGYGEGTSFAAPIVAGIAALARQANPALAPAQVADVIRRSAIQTLGTGWNEYTGAGLVNALGAVTLARTYDTTPPSMAFTAVLAAGGIQTDIDATDSVDPGKTEAGGVTIELETSRDGSTYGVSVPAGAAAVHRLLAASGTVWLRATACDANHNCVQQVQGPLVARSIASAKHASLKLRIVRRSHRKLTVSVALGKGATGKAVVQIEAWTGTRWRAFDRVSLRFGKTAIRTEHVTKTGRYKLRARLLATASYLQSTSSAITLRVK
jgi:subtilisin family serine protease